MVGGLTDMVLFCDSKLAAESLARITGWAAKNLDRSNPYAFGGTEWYTLSENLYRADRRPATRAIASSPRSGTTPNTGTSTPARATSSATAAAAGGPASITPIAMSTPSAARRRRISTPAIAGSSTRSSTPTTARFSAVLPTGGFGPDEQLLPRDAWIKKADYSHNSFETQCGCFAVFKLCKYLLTITGEARYGDWIERLAYNGIAATIPMSADGRVFYYSDYTAMGGASETILGWSCCTAPARWRWPTCTTWSTSAATMSCT